ncbi:hypothetical protein BLA60_17815 [Actinophytocola xinjiangensis]|uniref:Carrier domain-containing protein n=1 Tax=Actinophytocola xinjiangensis TaxID=485602 RepID=A0A7Z1AXU4_9PSEU|nr:phosphopantetheine-binding protein [Actinophytocola xinjiangensis]OLF09654.1 hypothetical protein BLA60_17815 [Actinophytocola xinjiangensis]
MSDHNDSGDPDPAQVITDSWRTVLGVPTVVADDDFFELGGDSIMVTRIVSYLRRALDVEVDMLQVWDTPVFADFRDAVTALVNKGTE